MIVYHPWYAPEYEILNLEESEVQDQSSRRSHKVGAPVPVEDVHDSYVLAAAEVAVTGLNKRSNSLHKTMLVDVLHGTVQARMYWTYSLYVYCMLLC